MSEAGEGGEADAAKPQPIGWRRVGAFAIDAILIGAVGVILGWTVFDLLAELGEGARLIGLVLATAYFAILSSRVGGGRTVGQRALKLRVIGPDGLPPSFGRAFIRALILVSTFVLNGIMLNAGPVANVIGLAAIMAIFGLGLAQLYLLIFNGPSRRLVHDLATGTAVVALSHQGPPTPVRPLHLRIALSVVGIVLTLAVGLSLFASNTNFMAAERSQLAAVQALPEVMTAGLTENTSTFTTMGGGTTTTHSLVVNARLNHWPKDQNAEAARIGRAVVAVRRPSPGQTLVVRLDYGFNIGFGSGWRSFSTAIALPSPDPQPTKPQPPGRPT